MAVYHGTRVRPTRTIRLPALRLPTLPRLRQSALDALTLGSFVAGTAAAWDAWGRPAGLGVACVAGLLVRWLSDGGKA